MACGHALLLRKGPSPPLTQQGAQRQDALLTEAASKLKKITVPTSRYGCKGPTRTQWAGPMVTPDLLPDAAPTQLRCLSPRSDVGDKEEPGRSLQEATCGKGHQGLCRAPVTVPSARAQQVEPWHRHPLSK